MKTIPIILIAISILLAACKKDHPTTEQATSTSNTNEQAGPTRRTCGTDEVFARQLLIDPSLRESMDRIEQVLQQPGSTSGRAAAAIVEIPVIVNVLYRTAVENISNAQIDSQISVLNQAYNNPNPSTTPYPFVRANVGIRFRLKSVVRKATSVVSWTTNDAIKKTTTGGVAAISTDSVLNIWVGNLGGGLMGYAQFPGGNPLTDGVVIHYRNFGNTGVVVAPFNGGTTAVHEIAHFFSLKHIGTCTLDDGIPDTPPHSAANYGCPPYPHYSTCTPSALEMTINYMEYVDDACMNMFTNGQRNRIHKTFETGGGRSGFAH